METQRKHIFESKYKQVDEETLYSIQITKYDRHGYKPRARILLLTNAALYILDEKDMKPKHRLPYKVITSISTSNLSDGLLIIKIPMDMKRDKVALS